MPSTFDRRQSQRKDQCCYRCGRMSRRLDSSGACRLCKQIGVTNIYYNHNYYIQIQSTKDVGAVLSQLQHRDSRRFPTQVAEMSSQDGPSAYDSSHPPPVRRETKPVYYESGRQPCQERGDLPGRDTV